MLRLLYILYSWWDRVLERDRTRGGNIYTINMHTSTVGRVRQGQSLVYKPPLSAVVRPTKTLTSTGCRLKLIPSHDSHLLVRLTPFSLSHTFTLSHSHTLTISHSRSCITPTRTLTLTLSHFIQLIPPTLCLHCPALSLLLHSRKQAHFSIPSSRVPSNLGRLTSRSLAPWWPCLCSIYLH